MSVTLPGAPAALSPVLTTRDLVVGYGGSAVLDGVDLDLYAGELVGLLGPNGAGKTTLLRTIMGLIRSQGGSVQVQGQIGYVPQRHDFAWDFPVDAASVVMSGLTRQIGIFRWPTAAHWQMVRHCLERVGLWERAATPIGQLSGGQRQRVLIARALVTDPALLLLDEPFTGLDQPSTESLTDLFKSLAAEGRCLLMSTHDLPGALDACDRLALLRGQIRALAAPHELRDPLIWQQTFEVSPRSPLLRVVTAFQGTLPPSSRPARN